jgi:hypothetical protein
MSNENIIIKWKVYEKLHTILFFYSPTTMKGFMFNDKEK